MKQETRVSSLGFTMVELVAVVAVTGIVAALVFSAYRTHLVRTQVATGIERAMVVAPSIVDSFRRTGEVPADHGAAGIHETGPSTYVSDLQILDGRIDIVYGRQADGSIAGRRLSLTPYETADLEVVWLCGNKIPQPGLEPLGFAGGGRQSLQLPTTVPSRYLPRSCR